MNSDRTIRIITPGIDNDQRSFYTIHMHARVAPGDTDPEQAHQARVLGYGGMYRLFNKTRLRRSAAGLSHSLHIKVR